jgi:hypothetical protein
MKRFCSFRDERDIALLQHRHGAAMRIDDLSLDAIFRQNRARCVPGLRIIVVLEASREEPLCAQMRARRVRRLADLPWCVSRSSSPDISADAFRQSNGTRRRIVIALDIRPLREI